MENIDNEIIMTPDGEVSSLPASMQVYQAIYNEITGKTEEITDSYNDYLILTLPNIFHLQQLLQQFLEQYNVSALNTSITIFHIKSTKETFSSFERLNTYNINNNSPIERVNIELNILITPPKTNKPQNYKVSINLISGAAMLEKIKPALPEGLPGMVVIRAIQEKAAIVKIEYVDYIIARSISDLAKEWINSIEKNSSNKKVKSLQEKSHLFKKTISLSFLLISLIISVYYAEAILTPARQSHYLLAQFLLISGVSILLAREIGTYLGRTAEHAIDSINTNEVSFIKINEGDKKQFDKLNRDSAIEKAKAWRSIFVAFGIGVASSIAATVIYSAYLT